MWHVVPGGGLHNHGYVTLTPKFWFGLIDHNGYEIVDFHAQGHPFDIQSGGDYISRFDQIQGFEDLISGSNSWLFHLLLRKRSDRLWIPPIDIAATEYSGVDYADIYLNAVARFYDPRLHGQKIADTVTWFMGNRQKDVTVSHLSEETFEIRELGTAVTREVKSKARAAVRRIKSGLKRIFATSPK